MYTAEDIARAIQLEDFEEAEELLEEAVRRILRRHNELGTEVECAWIRYCNNELCISVMLIPTVGMHPAVSINTLNEIANLLVDIGNMVYPGNPYDVCVTAGHYLLAVDYIIERV